METHNVSTTGQPSQTSPAPTTAEPNRQISRSPHATRRELSEGRLTALGWPISDASTSASPNRVIRAGSLTRQVPPPGENERKEPSEAGNEPRTPHLETSPPFERGKLQLDKVVMLMRHGICAPKHALIHNAGIDASAWGVPPGHLTEHGRAAIGQLAAYQREDLIERGVLENRSSPRPGDLFVYADAQHRTVETAKSWLRAMYPEGEAPCNQAARAPNLLFSPIQSGLSPLDPEKASREVLDAIGGSLDVAQARYAPEFEKLDDLLHEAHREAPENAGPLLAEMPWGIEPQAGGVVLTGPAFPGAVICETFSMQYAEGPPIEKVAFGRAPDSPTLHSLLTLRSVLQNVSSRQPHFAKRGGSQLMNQILLALEDQGQGSVGGPPAAKVLLYVGHGTNITHLASLLNFDWQLADYRRNDMPPGGTLAFERLRHAETNEQFVRVSYIAQSLDQIRDLEPLSHDSPPHQAIYGHQAGATSENKALAPLGDFSATLRQRLDPRAISSVEYAAISEPALADSNISPRKLDGAESTLTKKAA